MEGRGEQRSVWTRELIFMNEYAIWFEIIFLLTVVFR